MPKRPRNWPDTDLSAWLRLCVLVGSTSACDSRTPPAAPECPAAVWITLDSDTVYADAAMTRPLAGARWVPGSYGNPPMEPHFPAWIRVASGRTSGSCRYVPASDSSGLRWLRDDEPRGR